MDCIATNKNAQISQDISRDNEAFEMRYGENYTVSAIAIHLGVSRVTVYEMLRRESVRRGIEIPKRITVPPQKENAPSPDTTSRQ